ncbi:MAG: response regulator, partial [Rectinemataceae bacterium]|nr:response regulator [Rectinemataceae bacterium]
MKESILVVDDDFSALQMVEQFLKLKKYDTVSCLTFRDAKKELAPDGRFSAVVLDYFMPDTTGLEMMREIHLIDPELPVIILTGHNDLETAVRLMKKGSADYLVKPV